MKRLALVRRRSVWLPTAWGWLALLLVAGAGAVIAARNVYSFLATTEPVGARTLVVEGWLPPTELDQAIDVFRAGGYRRIVTTGGPISNEFERWGADSYAERARSYLLRKGVPDDTVIAVRAPASAQDRSFLSAVVVREWLARDGEATEALDVFSSGVHSRRSRALYRMAFGAPVRVGIYAATPSRPSPETWWRTSAGVKEVPLEALGWLWTKLFFRPAKPGSHEEMWGIVPDS
jgi:hypothetical protein